METTQTPTERIGNTGGAQTPAETKRQKGRSVKISFILWDGKNKNEVTENATFHCWGVRVAKRSDDTPKGPQFAETVGICELENGHVRLVRPEKIVFTDKTKPPEKVVPQELSDKN